MTKKLTLLGNIITIGFTHKTKRQMKTTKWKIDPAHSELGFKIKHLMIAHVNGTFRKFDVTVETNGDDFATAHILATVEVQSIDTNQAQRDNHLRTSDFFEAEKFPIAVFNSTKVERTGEDTYNVIGDLTLKGITKQVTLGVEYSGITKDPYGGAGRAGFSVTGKINRTEWVSTSTASWRPAVSPWARK